MGKIYNQREEVQDDPLEKVREDLRVSSRSIGQMPSIPEQIQRALHGLIVSGKLRPGDRLVERKVAREFGVGQPTAREALAGLEHEGLVSRRKRSGRIVTAISRKEFDQIFRLRVTIEPLAAELAAENRSNWKPDDLLATVKGLKTAARAHDVECFYNKDLEFHRSVWRLSENPYIERMLTQLVVPLFAFVMIKVVSDSLFDLESAAESHERLAQAIISGDKLYAAQTCRSSLDSFWKAGQDLLDRAAEQ